MDGKECQRPKRALSISTVLLQKSCQWKMKCVNALNGLFPFLREWIVELNISKNCVNALNGLFPFLRWKDVWVLILFICVNALNGLFPFLRFWRNYSCIVPGMCQRPKRALSISTRGVETIENNEFCVNALNGLFPFLRSILDKSSVFQYQICVNALNGLFPFLPKRQEIIDFIVKCVNALNGLFPFLLLKGEFLRWLKSQCVNALNGLFPFLQLYLV